MRWVLHVLGVGALVACTPVRAEPVSEAAEAADVPARQDPPMDEGTPPAPAPAPAPVPGSAPLVGAWQPPPHDPGALPRWIEHESLPRDSIESVALRYGVSPRRLRKWNGMSEHGQLHPRTPRSLRVHAQRSPPPRAAVQHTVVEGETWAMIGARYGVLGDRVRTWNEHPRGSGPELGEPLTVWVEPGIYAAILDDPRDAPIPAGGHSIGTPHAGRLVSAVSLPPGEGYIVRFPHSAFATSWTVSKLVASLEAFAESSDWVGLLIVGTMSRRRGGRIGGHISHQSGRDVDLRLPVREGVSRTKPARGRRVDWLATFELIEALDRSGAVQLILLDYHAQRRLYRKAKSRGVAPERLAELIQYPRGFKASRGLVRHSEGHEGHIHIRFTCGPLEPECGDRD